MKVVVEPKEMTVYSEDCNDRCFRCPITPSDLECLMAHLPNRFPVFDDSFGCPPFTLLDAIYWIARRQGKPAPHWLAIRYTIPKY